jgi:uncharacterized protein YciI
VDSGDLIMIGAFANPQTEGSMSIFTNREAAEEFVRGEPFVLHGVVRNWYIRAWNEVLVNPEYARPVDPTLWDAEPGCR